MILFFVIYKRKNIVLVLKANRISLAS